ncbi:YggN family protein [Shewanella youngdeokensis]|uniref:YggN family protein n=1 Tax=Shewanella youngdeokensis TaxID=2999068 RepID=A0ABZ0JVD9_9GAMM|nr:YggN family protein [Shewanella sp. DAU334]
MNTLLTSVGLCAVLVTASSFQLANAHDDSEPNSNNECEVSLHYDVTVEPQKLLISEAGTERYRIEQDQLFVNGNKVALSQQQQSLVAEYAERVSADVPEVIELVNEAVVMASTAVSMVLTPLIGDATGATFDQMAVSLQNRVETVAYQSGDKFYLGATESSLERAFDEEFEQEMEQLIKSSIGTMLVSIGSQMLSSEGGSFEQKMETFSAQMESIGDDIERQMDSQAQDLELRGNKLCDSFKSLVVLEKEMQTQIPELAIYSLVGAPTQELLE